MKPITVPDYLGPYAEHPDATSEIRGTAARMLEKVNAALLIAEADGVELLINPLTGSHVSGSGNGGFRPKTCPVGASGSRHKSAEAVDLYDPERRLAAWSLANEARLVAAGILGLERPEWTPSWTHWQVVRVRSGRFAFVPSTAAPLAAAPAPWTGKAIA